MGLIVCFSLRTEAELELSSNFGVAFLSVLCCFSELSTFSSAKKGEVDAGDCTATTGELLLISATPDLSPLFDSNEGDTLSFVSVISTEDNSASTSGVFLGGGVGCVY